MLSHFSLVWLFLTQWTVAHQAPLSIGSSRQEYWSGLPSSPPGDLPDPGTETTFVISPALAGGFFTTSTTWEANKYYWILLQIIVDIGNSLAVQWIGLHASTAGGTGSVPGWRTKIPHAALHRQNVLDTEPSASHLISHYITTGQVLPLFTTSNFSNAGDRKNRTMNTI